MAVRLYMNLGLLAESERLPDSADTVVVVEPNIGSTSRTKGNLYLLVTGAGGRKLREATKIVASRIKDDYYYDLSAGISVCLRKAVRAANNILLHSPERPPVPQGEAGPIGIALAVVRGNELYVATLGPAEAYMVRQARLLTLPDASPETGLPAEEIDGPEVWHGEITAGDCLILMSPNITGRIGLGPIQDAVLQLHPQAAVEQIHRQFGSGSLGSTGGDGMLFIEATEVAATHKTAPLKPVWPADPMAGAPERSPIPLADTVAGGVTAMQTTARHAQVAADSWLRRGVYGLFDRMPQRPMSRGRVTPMTVRRERQQRAAVAVMGLLAVITIIGASMWFLSGTGRGDSVDRQKAAQQAHDQVLTDLSAVIGNGKDLMLSDPTTAYGYYKDAWDQLKIAQQNGYPAELLADSRAKVLTGLNRYFHVSVVQPQTVLTFGTDSLTGLVLGPDGAAYVLDNTANKVYRVSLDTGAKIAVVSAGQQPLSGGATVDYPRLMTVGGGDIVVLDGINSVWKWHPVQGNKTGVGSLIPVYMPDNVNWGIGVRAMGTFVINEAQNLYNLYVVVPSQKQIIKYTAAPDGSGYPKNTSRTNYLIVGQDVSNVDDMYVDGKVFVVQGGKITQYELGQAKGWTVDAPPDTVGDTALRPPPEYTRLTADDPTQDHGTFYAYDVKSRRIVAFLKSDGSIVGQYTVPENTPWFTALTGMFVLPATGGANPILYWTEGSSLMKASLIPAGPSIPVVTPGPSAPSAAPSTSGSAAAGPPSPKPSATKS
jgi:hypothetical protein